MSSLQIILPRAGKLYKAQAAVNDFNRNILKVETGTHQVVSLVEDRKLTPRLLPVDRMTARTDHLKEELNELIGAYVAGDLAETTDGLIDIIYIALGALSEMHVNASLAFDEVHDANMRKVNGRVAKRPNAGLHDAVKPEGWTGPDYSKVL